MMAVLRDMQSYVIEERKHGLYSSVRNETFFALRIFGVTAEYPGRIFVHEFVKRTDQWLAKGVQENARGIQ